jgi:soluble lytic murein transglycosylase-like protein
MPILLLLLPIIAAALYVTLLHDDVASEPELDAGGVAPNAGPSIVDSIETAGADILQSFSTGVEDVSARIRKVFALPARAEPYAESISAAEQKYGIPESLLGRTLFQESRFRPEVIDGRVTSPVGALGIAQFMPATARSMGVDPLNPVQSIQGAAAYLRRLYDRFGNWADALAAYNWGEGNVNAYLRTGVGAKGQQRPAENINYVSSILKDVSV